ncbi:MAG: hypothetical protein R2684_01185 [Pyrinomonadaceae bacterium]
MTQIGATVKIDGTDTNIHRPFWELKASKLPIPVQNPGRAIEELNRLFAEARFRDPVRQISVGIPAGSFDSEPLAVRGPIDVADTNPALPKKGNPAWPDRDLNGNAYRISSDGAFGDSVIFINGINTSLGGARETAASLSRLTGSPVDLVYNSGDPSVAADRALEHFDAIARQRAMAASRGLWPGARQVVWAKVYASEMAEFAVSREAGDWTKQNALQNPEAAETAANLILERLENGDGNVNVVGYSQGGAIGAEALRYVEAELVSKYGSEKATEMLGRVRILGLGAAADGNDFPEGVRFSGIAHRGDVVPRYFGISRNGSNPGIGSIFSALRPGNGWGIEQHVNYLDNQGSYSSDGDPISELLVRQWSSGGELGTRIIRDFN